MPSPGKKAKTTCTDITKNKLHPSNQGQSGSQDNHVNRIEELQKGEQTMLDTTLIDINRTPSPYYNDDADDDVFLDTDTKPLLSPQLRDGIPSPMTSTPRIGRIRHYPHNSGYSYAPLDSGCTQPSLPHYKTNKPVSTNKSGSTNSIKYRQRRMFTSDQLLLLEENFQTMPYPKNADFAHLEGLTGIDGSSLRIWFQNRRVKARKNGQTGIRSTVGRPCKQVATSVPTTTTYEQMTQIRLPPNHPFCVIDGTENMSANNDETGSLSPNDSVEVRSVEVIKKQKTQPSVSDQEFITRDNRLKSLENRMSDIFPSMTSSPIISTQPLMPFPFPLMGVADQYHLKGYYAEQNNDATAAKVSEQPLDLSMKSKSTSPRPGIQRPWEDSPKRTISNSSPAASNFVFPTSPNLVSLMQYQYATAMQYASLMHHSSMPRSHHH